MLSGNRRAYPRNAVAVTGVVLLLGLGNGGCTSSGATEVRTPPSARIKLMRTVVVQVDSTVPNSENSTRELEGAIIEQLRQRRAFGSVYSRLSSQGRTADMTIQVIITSFTGLSELGRVFTGPFVQSMMSADVVLKGRDGENLGVAKVEGTGGGAGTTMEAVQRTAEQVAAFATGN